MANRGRDHRNWDHRAGVLSGLCASGARAHSRFQSDEAADIPRTLIGDLFRVGVGAMPFLLPLLLQVGFHLSPFQSGLITFTSTMGALIVKGAAPAMLKRFGFRTILMNAILGGLSISACAIFTESTPFLVMVAILMVGGFFRSLQFTSINALAYAEVPRLPDEPSHRAGRGRSTGVARDRRRHWRADGRIRRANESAARRRRVGFPRRASCWWA